MDDVNQLVIAPDSDHLSPSSSIVLIDDHDVDVDGDNCQNFSPKFSATFFLPVNHNR